MPGASGSRLGRAITVPRYLFPAPAEDTEERRKGRRKRRKKRRERKEMRKVAEKVDKRKAEIYV